MKPQFTVGSAKLDQSLQGAARTPLAHSANWFRSIWTAELHLIAYLCFLPLVAQNIFVKTSVLITEIN